MIPEHPKKLALALSWFLVFGGGMLAWLVQTDLGNVEVKDVRFQGESDATLSTLLDIPQKCQSKQPCARCVSHPRLH